MGQEGLCMKRVIEDIKKYQKYLLFASKSELKAEVSSSYLNWLWWILDPLLFMCVYSFVSLIVFQKPEKYFAAFVFIGLTVWNFFSKTVNASVKLVKKNSAIVSKVYIPKYFLILQRMFVNGFKMMVSFALVVVIMCIYRVPISIKVFYFIPLLLLLVIVTFACSAIVMHFGVFVEDLANVIQVFLRLVFYMSGIFYSIAGRVEGIYGDILLNCNPIAYIISAMRDGLLYQNTPNLMVFGIWTLVGVLFCVIGIKVIYKYENSYVKVI